MSPTLAPQAAPTSGDGSFADLGVPASMADSLAARGILAPFPIQSATIPDALAGRDVSGRAPTGSGKTLAFGVPLMTRSQRATPRRPRALVLVPTRELASQVADELRALGGRRGPRVETFYGGVSMPKQITALRRGVDVAVACPGRLADLVAQGACDLRDVDLVVVDEADRMADMGFLPEVRRLLDRCSADRQTLLFSATLDGDVDVLVTRYQRDPVRHEHAEPEQDQTTSRHLFWSVERPDRISTTAEIVSRSGPTVVFCRTKRGADRVARQLAKAGIAAAAIHGDRSQSQRERALRSFHRGDVAALVATDVAARGIHVDGVACVVHFDATDDPKSYVHRSGRTARAGATGVVISLVVEELRRDVKKLQRSLGHPVGLADPDPTSLGAPGRSARRDPEATSRPTSRQGAPKGRSRRRRPARRTGRASR